MICLKNDNADMRGAICSRNGNVDYTCRLLKLYGYEYIINTPPVDLESFLKNLLTKILHW